MSNGLEDRGVILGYHTRLDPAALGFANEAFIGLQTIQGPTLGTELDGLMHIAEVESVHVVTGHWDLIVRVRVRDNRHLRDVVLGRIWELPGFRHSETLVVYEVRDRPGGWSVAL